MYKKKRVYIVIFARSNSTRLINKIYKKIKNQTLLQISINKAKSMKYIDKIIVATTFNKSDDRICLIAKKNGISYFRGPENNVLSRLYFCIKNEKADYIVRYCCDNYLNENKLIEENIRRAVKYNLDLITPGEVAIVTKGASQVVISKNTILKVYKFSKNKIYNEHIENYCFENWKKFKIDYQITSENLYFDKLNFSIDTRKDISFVSHNNINNIYQYYKLRRLNNKIYIKNKMDESYFVQNNKYVYKNRIGYKSIKNFYYPEKENNILNLLKQKRFFTINNLVKVLFSVKFKDYKENIYYPSYKNKKFIKIKFKNDFEKDWSSYKMQKYRIIAYRELFNFY